MFVIQTKNDLGEVRYWRNNTFLNGNPYFEEKLSKATFFDSSEEAEEAIRDRDVMNTDVYETKGRYQYPNIVAHNIADVWNERLKGHIILKIVKVELTSVVKEYERDVEIKIN